MFDTCEVKAWEEEQLSKYFNVQIKEKRNFDPRIKKLLDYRNHRKTKYYYSHEVKEIRKLTQRKFRLKFKKNIDQEEFFGPVPHDYRTYGWLSY